MKISEVVAKLTEILETHGDLTVFKEGTGSCHVVGNVWSDGDDVVIE